MSVKETNTTRHRLKGTDVVSKKIPFNRHRLKGTDTATLQGVGEMRSIRYACSVTGLNCLRSRPNN